MSKRRETKTGGRPASIGVIPGRFALSVGKPDLPAPTGWQWTALTDVARLETGHTPSRRYPEYWDGDIPWIGIVDATSNHGRVINDTIQHTTQLGIDNSSARILPTNTVCLSRTASVGYVVVMGRPMATSQDFVNWVCSEALDYRYLKYVLLAERDSFLRFASGTTHQTIYFPEVKAFHACLPSEPEQRAIADLLSILDDKIELNRRMNETSETLIRSFFKSWFANFDPVRAKMAGRKPAGMSPEVAKLFPDSFEDSHLGKIPKRWTIAPIGDLVRAVGGSTPSTKEARFWTDGVHCWATPKDLAELRDPVLLDTAKHLTDEGLAEVPSGLLPAGTVLLSSRAPIGYLAITQVPVAVNQGFIAMVCDKGLPNIYVLQWCRSNMDTIISHANGSTFLEISKSVFRPLLAVRPNDSVMDAFMRIAGPLHDRVVANVRESSTLLDLRDTLLPKLLSGEIRIKDAEKKVAAAT